MALNLQQHHQQVHVCGRVSSGLSTRNHDHVEVGGGVVSGFSLNHLFQTTPFTLDLLPSETSSLPVELDSSSPLPLGWQKFLDLKSGAISYKKVKQKGSNTTMSRNGKVPPKLDLKLNLSPPREIQEVDSPRRSTTSSPPSSCISSENADMNSPEATSMMLVGCPRCLMYVMLSENDPKCPKCKSSVLLDFLHENTTKNTRKN